MILDLDTARTGVYLDFEGSRSFPDLATVVAWDENVDDLFFNHFVLADDLHPVAEWSRFPGSVASSIEGLARHLERELEMERMVFAWSHYEASVLGDLLAGDQMWIVDEIANAKIVAEQWLKRTNPGHPIFALPKGKRHKLAYYLDLIDYDDPVAREFQPAVGINEMRRALRETGGVLDDVDDDVLDLWAKTLERNHRDCHGMREVMLRVVG